MGLEEDEGGSNGNLTVFLGHVSTEVFHDNIAQCLHNIPCFIWHHVYVSGEAVTKDRLKRYIIPENDTLNIMFLHDLLNLRDIVRH